MAQPHLNFFRRSDASNLSGPSCRLAHVVGQRCERGTAHRDQAEARPKTIARAFAPVSVWSPALPQEPRYPLYRKA
jgi:hypothetical protein